MTQIEIIDNPELDGTRRALVLTEDRVGHYPEFRDFFVRRFALNSAGLSRPGYVRAPSGMIYALVFIGRSGEPFPDGIEIYALPQALEVLDDTNVDRDCGRCSMDHRRCRRRVARRGPGRDRTALSTERRHCRIKNAAFATPSPDERLVLFGLVQDHADSGSNWPTQGSRASTAAVWA